MKLGLGSAQFGLDYGVSNALGKVPESVAERIVRMAADRGIEIIDTALAYGTSQAVLGRILWDGHPFRIITKTAPNATDHTTATTITQVRDGFLRSLEALRQPCVDGLLIHRASNVTAHGGKDLIDTLGRLKEEGLVRKIGVSFYTAKEIEAVLKVFTPDLVQVPVNILDQRLIEDGSLAALSANKIEIHARSVFLQGLLLMDLENIPAALREFQPVLRKFSERSREMGLPPAALAMAFVCQQPTIDATIIGVTSEAELQDAASACEIRIPIDTLRDLSYDDERLLNPSLWPSIA